MPDLVSLGSAGCLALLPNAFGIVARLALPTLGVVALLPGCRERCFPVALVFALGGDP